MKALSLGFLLAITTLSSVHAQRSPESLPAVTVDCYQSFAAKAPLPELPSKEIAIDGDNFETPLIRYRLLVADKTGFYEQASDCGLARRIAGWNRQAFHVRL